MHLLRHEGLDFLKSAPLLLQFEAHVKAPRAKVFAEVSADPCTWTWFPGLTGGNYEGDGTPGLGSVRQVQMGDVIYRETILAWDAPNRWAYRVDEASVDFLDALVEDWRFSDATDGTRVTWAFAAAPKGSLMSDKAGASTIVGTMFRDAMSGLQEHVLDRPS